MDGFGVEMFAVQRNKIPSEEIARRVDHRDAHVFSIDPPGCRDIDDALHLSVLPNGPFYFLLAHYDEGRCVGNYQVGVHIADVGYFIKPDSALDCEAARRGTSVYLVDRRIDMIPAILSTDICSLHADMERLTFTAAWEMTPDAEIIDTKFYKSVIRSKDKRLFVASYIAQFCVAAMTYAQAQEMIETSQTGDTANAVRLMNQIAKKLRAKRITAGALLLASSEVKFLLDQTEAMPTDIEMYQLKDAHSLVEEFMLLANISVAKQVLRFFPTFACLRYHPLILTANDQVCSDGACSRHPAPPLKKFEPLIRAARIMGFTFDVHDSKALAESLNKAELKEYPYFNQLIRIMATRCMAQAVYFSAGDYDSKDYHHYGLACPVYTHFTSPIRRYAECGADIVVHRLLAASLGIDPLPSAIEDRERMRNLSENLNYRHRMAQMASRASTDLYQLLFFKHKRISEEAVVISVKSTGVRVFVPRFGLEGNILLGEDKSRCIYDEEGCMLTTPIRRFRIFDRLKVIIYTTRSKAQREWLTIEVDDRSCSSCRRESKAMPLVTEEPVGVCSLISVPHPLLDCKERASTKSDKVCSAGSETSERKESVHPMVAVSCSSVGDGSWATSSHTAGTKHSRNESMSPYSHYRKKLKAK